MEPPYKCDECGAKMESNDTFTFDDIRLFDKSVIKLVLDQRYDFEDRLRLPKALKLAAVDTQEKILSCMTAWEADKTREEIKSLDSITDAEYRAAQNKIISLIEKMEASGEIIVAEGL
jgi:flagellar motor switch protein FliG